MDSELEDALWHKSTYSGNDNNCVERGKLVTGRQAVRDTKDRERGALIFGANIWQNFVNGIRDNAL